MTKVIDYNYFESKTSNQKEIYFSGFGNAWDVQIVYNSLDRHYYLKGPFGRFDAICYYDLGPISELEIRSWIANFERESARLGVPTRNSLRS